MTVQVQISDKYKDQTINAIKQLRGVREVLESSETKKSHKSSKSEKLPIETKADYKAWKKARKDLQKGETYSLEFVKQDLGL